ncbi:MAG: ABC-type branched-chain amino acid transport system, periplasmic component, partial [Deltaproteobacteria bacterium]|nr:ABC-type branched-chain amino acid transport system, periplasmic component [Deltaproteobacteria bacterium]
MRDTGYFRVIVGMIGLFFLMVSGAPSFAQTKDPIKIGVIANMGWPVGKSAAQAVQLGVKKINDEGGLLGRPIKLIEADSKGQVPNAVAEYRKLVMTDKVYLVVVAEGGTLTLACQKAGAELFKEYPHIMMNAGASALEIPKNVRDNYDQYKFSFTLYTTGPDRFLWASIINTFLTTHQMKPKAKKVAILGEDLLDYNPYWQGWPEYGFRPYAEVAYKDRGVEVVYTSKIAVGEKMFLPIFEKIAASGAEYIDFAMSAYSDFYVLAKQWSTSAARDIPFFHSGVSPKYWEVTNGACLGMVGWWPSDLTNYEVVGKTREYVQGFYKTFGYPGSNWLAEGAYDDVIFWVEGVKNAKTLDSESVIKSMEKIEVDCTRGKMKINPTDHCS